MLERIYLIQEDTRTASEVLFIKAEGKASFWGEVNQPDEDMVPANCMLGDEPALWPDIELRRDHFEPEWLPVLRLANRLDAPRQLGMSDTGILAEHDEKTLNEATDETRQVIRRLLSL